MITHTPLNYIGLRLAITALRLITPLSIFYVSYSIADHPTSVFGKLLLTWCALEAAFWAFFYIPRSRALQAKACHPPPLPREERKALYWKCWDKIPNPEWYVSMWFLGARVESIRKGDLKSFFRWAWLNRGDGEDMLDASTENGTAARNGEMAGDEVEMVASEEEELEEYADGVQTLLGRRLEGGQSSAKSLRLTIDQVKMLHRPLFWYMIVGLVDSLTAIYLRRHKFILYRTSIRSTFSILPWRIASLFTRQTSPAPDISYWYRPHTSKTRLPVLFIHGISMGLYSYAQFLTDINKQDVASPSDGEIGIICLEIMPISFRITSPIPTKEEMCRQIKSILDHHGFDRVVLASHSYGSVITTHLLQDPQLAPRIGPMLLVDPVTFLLHLPDVAYNFTARKPRRANEHQLYYFASTDMMVAHTLSRHFFWAQNILWKDELNLGGQRDVTVSLAGRDLITDTETVGRYISGVGLTDESDTWKQSHWKGHGLETIWFGDCDHAQVFERAGGRRILGEVLRKYVSYTSAGDDEQV